MANGGYKVIDLKNSDFTPGVGVKIPGIHNSIEASYRKPTLLSGIVVSSIEYPARYQLFTVSDGNFTTSVNAGADYTLTVGQDDTATFAVVG